MQASRNVHRFAVDPSTLMQYASLVDAYAKTHAFSRGYSPIVPPEPLLHSQSAENRVHGLFENGQNTVPRHVDYPPLM